MGHRAVDHAPVPALVASIASGRRIVTGADHVGAARVAWAAGGLDDLEPGPAGATAAAGRSRRRSRPSWRPSPTWVARSPTCWVDAFLEAAGLRLVAMESTERPARPLVSGAVLAEWAEWADSTTFSANGWRWGFDATEVDAFLKAIRDAFLGVSQPPIRADEVRGTQFSPTDRYTRLRHEAGCRVPRGGRHKVGRDGGDEQARKYQSLVNGRREAPKRWMSISLAEPV